MLTHHYRYDPLNRLTHSANIQRFYHHLRMTTEIQDTVRYSVFQSGDTVLAQTRSEGGASECSLLASGIQRSVLQEVSPDGSRSIAYSAYGHSCEPPVLGFNGERADPMTGHFLLGNGYRAFNPVLMRFNSPDSWSPFGRGGINCYAYCEGDPVNNADPSGHQIFGFVKGFLHAFNQIPLLEKKVINPVTQLAESKVFRSTNFEALDEALPGIYVGTDYTRAGKARLTVDGHGSYAPKTGGFMGSNGRHVNAEELHAVLKRKYLKEHSMIRLLVCNSANGGANSLGARLADLSGLPVKAYGGKVASTGGPSDILRAFKENQKKLPEISDIVFVFRDTAIVRRSYEAQVEGVNRLIPYAPQTFRPSRS